MVRSSQKPGRVCQADTDSLLLEYALFCQRRCAAGKACWKFASKISSFNWPFGKRNDRWLRMSRIFRTPIIWVFDLLSWHHLMAKDATRLHCRLSKPSLLLVQLVSPIATSRSNRDKGYDELGFTTSSNGCHIQTLDSRVHEDTEDIDGISI